MKIIRSVVLVAFGLLCTACSPTEYTEINFQNFPENYKKYDRYPWEMFQIEEFSQAYEKVLDDLPKHNFPDNFILELGLVSTGNRYVSTQQGPFIFISGCKPHFCMSTELYALYDPRRNRVWVYVEGEDIHSELKYNCWLGRPGQSVQNLILLLKERQVEEHCRSLLKYKDINFSVLYLLCGENIE